MRLPRFLRKFIKLADARRDGAACCIEPLEGRRLLAGQGLAGYYFTGTDFTQVKLRRQDAEMNFNWSGTPDASIPAGAFGVRWSGQIMPRFSGRHYFYTRTTGGVRLWVNDQLIINDWTIHPLKDNKASIVLRVNTRVNLRVEYFDSGGPRNFVQLHWAGTKLKREVVPYHRLFACEFDTTPPKAPTNLRTTYLTDTAFKFAWNASSDDSGTIIYDVYQAKTKVAATTGLNLARAGRNPQTNYTMYVKAVDFAGNVSVSQGHTIRTTSPFADGNGSGLAATYFGSTDFSNYRLTRTDPQVMFASGDLPFDTGQNEPLSARWSGTILPKYQEFYTFRIASDGGVRMWIGEKLLIDRWNQQGAAEHTASLSLKAGQSYPIRLEYRHWQGDAMVRAYWSSLSTKLAPIPASQLFPAFVDNTPPSAPQNLRLESATQSALSIRWDAAGDDVGLVRYDVYRNSVLIGSTRETYYSDGGLDADTTYSYMVLAIDGAALASWPSSALAAKTAAPAPRDATGILPAVDYNGASGVTRSGSAITSLDGGDWVKYSNLDFGSGVRSWRVKLGVPVASAGGTIELRIDSPTGALIGSHVVQPTGSYDTGYWQQASTTTVVSGKHDLYLVFRGGSGVANIESFQFKTQRLVRIMPLGDSITDGQAGRSSYRYDLYHKLTSADYGVDFVGSRIQNFTGEPASFDFDQNHEGHSGWRADEILQSVVGWMQSYNPEVVLLHIGTNDIWLGQSISSTVSEIAQIIDAIHNYNPSITVLLARLIPLVGYENEIADLNVALDEMVANREFPSETFGVVDMHTDFSLSGDTFDGVHPNVTGADKLAQRWYDALLDLLV